MEKIGERLREYRLRQGLSKRALAARIGVSVPTVMRWEGGISVPNDYNLYKIEQILADQRVTPKAASSGILLLPLFTTVP